MSRHSAHPFRRTALVAIVAAASTVIAMVVPGLASAQEDDDFVSGSGRAKSTIVKLGPSAARLSLAPSVGVALADHIGTLGRGETLIIDYATLDTSINNNEQLSNLKVEFPSLRVESRDEGSEAGVRWEPKPGFVEDAAATGAPVGRSAITIEDFDIPGLIEVSGGKARSFSGVYKRTQTDGDTETEELIRAAGGTVDIARVELLGGQLVLSGLRWEGAQISDRNEDADVEELGNFYIGKVVAQGETVFSEISGDEVGPVFDAVNQGLEPLGITLTPPTIQTRADVVTVSPLGLTVASDHLRPLVDAVGQLRRIPVPSNEDDEDDIPLSERFVRECQAGEDGGEAEGGEGGGASTGGLLGRVDPGGAVLANHGGQHEEFNELNSDGPRGTQQDPEPEFPGAAQGGSDCGLPFLALDLALAPIGGGGQFDIALGGVLGFTEAASVDQFDLFGTDFDGFDADGGEFDVSGDDGGGVAPPHVGGNTVAASDPTTPPTQANPPPQGGEQQAAGPESIRLTGSRASAAWAVGLVGLGMAMAMALSDYRRLRARSRAITPIS